MNARTKPAEPSADVTNGAESAAETQTDTSAPAETVAGASIDDGGYASPADPTASDAAPPETASTMGLVNKASPAPTGDELLAKAIAKGGINGPRVTEAKIAAEIESEFYFTPMDAARGLGIDGNIRSDSPMARLTLCVLVLKNGFTVIGENKCVSPENYDPAIGNAYAREDAERKIWLLLGFRLADRIHHNLPL